MNHYNQSSFIMSSSTALFGKYELGRLLGCGAFAKVYHARNIFTGQSVAIKVISKKKIAGTNHMSNIKREISIMSKLRHPNIVRLHEVLASKSKIFFVMDFVKGGELFAKVAKGRFSEELSRKYFRQLISAVGFCHSRGIYHRDLKPENLLVDENGDLKVSDFGLSAVKDQIRPDGLLHTLCGTPAYVAPEILTKKGYHGPNVDVWSCGVILYVLTAGYLPFNDPNLMNMYKKIYKGEYRCPKWMSSDLRKFLSKLLATNPSNRITIEEMAKDPWFRKGGYKEEVKCYQDYDYLFDFLKFHNSKREDHWGTINEGGGAAESTSTTATNSPTCTDTDVASSSICSLNAFDLISFSSGLDMSGIFDESRNPAEDGQRFLSKESPEKIIEKIEECVEKEEDVIVKRKKEWGVELDGYGANGGFVATVEMSPLTDELVVVEVKRRAGDPGCYRSFWKKTLMPQLQDSVCEENTSESQDVIQSTGVESPPPTLITPVSPTTIDDQTAHN